MSHPVTTTYAQRAAAHAALIAWDAAVATHQLLLSGHPMASKVHFGITLPLMLSHFSIGPALVAEGR